MLPLIRYRLLSDGNSWFVRWYCASCWMLVYGPVPEAQAREWVDGMMAQAL